MIEVPSDSDEAANGAPAAGGGTGAAGGDTGVPSGLPLTSSTVRFVQGLKRPKNLRPAAAHDSGAIHTALSTASSESEDTSVTAPSRSIGCGPVGPEKQRKSDDGEKSEWSRRRQLFEGI